MNNSRVLDKLRRGEPALCVKTGFNDPGIVELIGTFGFDCIWLCQEHMWANPQTLASQVLAARATGTDAMVRIDKSGPSSAFRPLEMGAQGLMVPHIRSVEEAKTWIDAMRFPPLGNRGLDGVNADTDWGSCTLAEYLKHASKETFLLLQLEDPVAFQHLGAIADLDGFDVIFVGIGDLSLRLGCPGDFQNEELWEIVEHVAKVAIQHGKTPGIPGISPAFTKRVLDLGYRFITSGADLRFIRQGYTQLQEDFGELGFTFAGANSACEGRAD